MKADDLVDTDTAIGADEWPQRADGQWRVEAVDTQGEPRLQADHAVEGDTVVTDNDVWRTQDDTIVCG